MCVDLGGTDNGLVIIVLDNSVVGNVGFVLFSRGRALEEERSHDEHPPFDGGILLDDLCVEPREEEKRRQQTDTTTGTHGYGSDIPTGLLAQTQAGRSLVHNG